MQNTAAQAFVFKHNVDYAYFQEPRIWFDSLGNERTGKEPDRRCHLRYVLQKHEGSVGA